MTFTDACLVRARAGVWVNYAPLAVARPAAVPRPLVHSGALHCISWHLWLGLSSEGFPACRIPFFLNVVF